jgi:hypothetical protein
VDFINAGTKPTFTTKHFRILQLLISIGLILSIAGGTSGTTQPDGTIKVAITSKVGIALYIVAYIGLILVYFASLGRSYVVPPKERRVPIAIMFALPFVLVRLIYSACSVFLHSHYFNVVPGSIPVMVAMAVVEEFVVVAIYVALGFFVDKLDSNQQGTISGKEWKNKNKNGGGGGRGRARKYTGGPQPSDVEYGQIPLPPVHYQGVAK